MNARASTELLAAAAGSALITAEYQGKSYSFRADGWFNATEAAKRACRDAHEWVRLPDTKRYLAALERKYGKIPYLETRRGRHQGGTWFHPKLAVRFARWLDVDFEIWCDEQIDKILHGEPLDDDREDEVTTVDERMPLLDLALHGLKRFRISLPTMYRRINDAAGCANFRFMLRRQRAIVLPVALRITSGTDTQADWDLLHVGGRALRGDAQLELAFAAPALYNPLKESQ